MDEEKQYIDADGNKRSLIWMVRHEPEWATSVIRSLNNKINERKGFKFQIECPSEYSAGIIGFSDMVTITIDSGDPGGNHGEFEEWMRDSLREWYDGCGVEIVK